MGESEEPQPWDRVDHAQAISDGATAPPPPEPPVCRECGLHGERRPTYYGACVLLEPRREAPAHMVPPWHRWYVDSGGRAWNSGDTEPGPGSVCRVPHRLVCPGTVLTALGLWPWLDALRDENARRAQWRACPLDSAASLPEAG
ncbi:DUF6083 domain-containing protein [Streptomyces sp. TRM49041]|uniref:DUF6083 domain-containing protein n=1 Tax=Streptomyces sp. TRM49041 TaxID=2603216 RepID=UPI0011EC6912|nr:DUF6083 domain-containing protein [Streptomyces sp. TRM49041]